MTPLHRWMEEQGVDDAWVAERLGCSRVQANRVKNGSVGPSITLAKRLERLTGHRWYTFMKARGATRKDAKHTGSHLRGDETATQLARIIQLAEQILKRLDSKSADDDALMGLKETCQYFGGIKPPTLYRGIKKGLYPKQVKIGTGRHSSRWWKSECVEARDALIRKHTLRD